MAETLHGSSAGGVQAADTYSASDSAPQSGAKRPGGQWRRGLTERAIALAGLLLRFAVLIHIAAVGVLLAVALVVGWAFAAGPWSGGTPWGRTAGAIAALLIAFCGARHLARAGRQLLGKLDEDEPEEIAGVTLAQEDYPDLWQIVHQVSQRLAAPVPDELRLTPHTECFTVEMSSPPHSRGKRLILGLGLPLVAVLSVSELKIILAHELGHARLGHPRLDAWALRLLAFLQDECDARGRWWKRLDPLVWLCCASHQLVMRLLLLVRRWHELRADALSAAAYGGELASRTLLKEWLVAFEFASLAEPCDHSETLAVKSEINPVVHFVNRWTDFSDPALRHLERRLREEESDSFWDSHPTVAKRLEAMRRFPMGEVLDPRPVRELLPDLARLATQLPHQR